MTTHELPTRDDVNSDGEPNDVTYAYYLLSDFNRHVSDALTQGDTDLSDDYPTGATVTSTGNWLGDPFDDDGNLQGRLKFRKKVTVSLEAPAWKVDAFRAQIRDWAGDGRVTVTEQTSASFSGGVRYNDNGVPIPTGTPPDDEEQKTHKMTVEVTADVTDAFRG